MEKEYKINHHKWVSDNSARESPRYHTQIGVIHGNVYQGDRTEYKNCKFMGVKNPPNSTQKNTAQLNEVCQDNATITDAMLIYIKRKICDKYFELGEELHIPHQDLREIFSTYRDHPLGNQKMMLEMLKLWRQKLDIEESLSKLVDALRKIGAGHVADELPKLR